MLRGMNILLIPQALNGRAGWFHFRKRFKGLCSRHITLNEIQAENVRSWLILDFFNFFVSETGCSLEIQVVLKWKG